MPGANGGCIRCTIWGGADVRGTLRVPDFQSGADTLDLELDP